MSVEDTTTPEASGLKFTTIVRFAAILLGIGSATLMATKAFGLRFDDEFMAVLKLVENFVGTLVLPMELLVVKPLERLLLEHGITLHLHEHWKNAFVLLWLYFSAWARSFPEKDVHWRPFAWAFSGVAAAFAGIAAGLVPLSSAAVFWWLLSAIQLVYVGIDAWNIRFRDEGQSRLSAFGTDGFESLFWVAAIVAAALLADRFEFLSWPQSFWWAIFIMGFSNAVQVGFKFYSLTNPILMLILGLDLVPGLNAALASSPSPGLAAFATLITLEAGLGLLISPFHVGRSNVDDKRAYVTRWLSNQGTKNSIDILSVLGGAATIVYLAHLMS